jgi:quercetin dioxygenase-like cupin family protein
VSLSPPRAYVRLYTDADGGSRLEDVALAGEARGVLESELRAVFSEAFPARSASFRYVVEEASSGHPHNTPRRQFIVMLQGACEVEASNGERRELGPGTVLLLEDVEGEGHVTRRIGDENRLTLVIPLD